LGSGWAAGFGHIGGMLAPMLVGVLLFNNVPMNFIFLMFASVFVIISIIVLSLGIESKKKSLEEIDSSFKVKTT
ncbi:MAG: MFS transporter, partial [Selenomonadaceae bacterium]|nr:MFS transporter [Selenomonadaceae bacterium]